MRGEITTEQVREDFTWGGPRVNPDDEVLARRRARFDAWLAEHDAQVWDEGHEAGYADGTNPYTGLPPRTPNPYRADAMTRQADAAGGEVVEDRQPYQGPTTDLIMAGHDMSLAPHYPGPGKWCEACPTPAELVIPESIGTCSVCGGDDCAVNRCSTTGAEIEPAPAGDDEGGQE